MKEVTTPIIKKLNRVHSILFGVTIAALLGVMFLLFYTVDPSSNPVNNYDSITAEQIILLLTLVAVPTSLKMHSNRIKKLKADTSVTPVEKIEAYTQAFVRRISILEIVALVNIIFYAIKHSDNYMWLAVITLIAFVFCRASEKELLSLLQTEKETNDEK